MGTGPWGMDWSWFCLSGEGAEWAGRSGRARLPEGPFCVCGLRPGPVPHAGSEKADWAQHMDFLTNRTFQERQGLPWEVVIALPGEVLGPGGHWG